MPFCIENSSPRTVFKSYESSNMFFRRQRWKLEWFYALLYLCFFHFSIFFPYILFHHKVCRMYSSRDDEHVCFSRVIHIIHKRWLQLKFLVLNFDFESKRETQIRDEVLCEKWTWNTNNNMAFCVKSRSHNTVRVRS